jgi:hypothetical protein
MIVGYGTEQPPSAGDPELADALEELARIREKYAALTLWISPAPAPVGGYR